VIEELKGIGMEVVPPEGLFQIGFEDDPGGPATELMTGKPVKPVLEPADDERTATYLVNPMAGWKEYVKRTNKSGKWVQFSEERAEEFERVVARYGYGLGSVGGHPANFDYQKVYGGLTVSFFFLGNPYHM
jgi:hypothetical protein